MPLRTKEEVKAEIIELKADIAKAQKEQAYTSGGPGGGMHHQRGDLNAMYKRLDKLEAEYERLEALEKGSVARRAQFQRVR